jgi:superfamily I DNA/RNA helicase
VQRVLAEAKDPWVVCVTFTRNAARQMKHRILGSRKLTAEQKERLLIKTIDSLAKRFVTRSGERISGRDPLPCEYSQVFLSLLRDPGFCGETYVGKDVYLFVDEFQDVN